MNIKSKTQAFIGLNKIKIQILATAAFSLFFAVQTTLAGEDCSSITTLSGNSGSVSDTTAGKSYNGLTGSAWTAPDLIYQITVPNNYTLAIGASSTSYDSASRIALASGGCTNGVAAGSNIPLANLDPDQQYSGGTYHFHDDPNTQQFIYTNDTGTSQTIYWVQSGFSTSSGSFTLIWDMSPMATTGEDCSSIYVLTGNSGSVNGTTVGATYDGLAGTPWTSPDRIYQIDVPNNYTLTIGSTATSYDSASRIALASGGCTNGVAAGSNINLDDLTPDQQYSSGTYHYHDDPNTQQFQYRNISGSTQTIYWVQAGYSTNVGTYTLTWSIAENSLYQTPTVSSPCCNIGIRRVLLVGESVTLDQNDFLSPPDTANYTYFSTYPIPDLVAGNTYLLETLSGPTYGQVFSAWIDWNEDGDFTDANEQIANSTSHNANSYVSIYFTVPGGTTPGSKRLRVTGEYEAYSINTSGNGPNTYGEYEDYNIEVVELPISEPQSLTLVDSSTPGQVTLSWEMPANNGGSPFDDYIILYGENGGACDPTDINDGDCSVSYSAHSPTNPQSTTITGLDSNYQYRFAVFATNTSQDVSSASNTVVAPPTTVFNVSPNSANNGGIATGIFIEGTYFYNGPTPPASTAKLVRGNTEIDCVPNEITNTNFDCDFDLTSAPAGIYSIVITNFDGETATLPNSFTVNAGPMTLSGISPNQGTINGDTEVTITGTNFFPTYYQIPYSIENALENISDFQVALTLDTASLISSGKMRTDCGDIRVKDIDQTTDLNFWFEGPCNDANSTIWVKLPELSTGGNLVFVTYGNLALTSASNASNTFVGTVSSLQANWPMDETVGDNMADTSGNSYNATFQSGGYIYNGKYGYSRYFGGSRYATAGNPAGLQITGSLTLETWVNLSSEGSNYPRLISKLSCFPYNGYELLIGATDGPYYLARKPYLQLGNSGSLYTASSSINLSPDGNWHHVVAVYDTSLSSNKGRIYIDGVDVTDDFNNTIDSSSAIGATSTDLNLSRFCGGNYLDGSLDETRIYNRALSTAEVADLYENRGFSSSSLPNTLLLRKNTESNLNISSGVEQGKGLEVYFDGLAANNVFTLNDTTLIAHTPAHPEGTVDVEVINGNSYTETLTAAFTYRDRRLKITSINAGNDVVVNEPFSITVQAVESDNTTPYNVESDTYYTLQVQNGSGYLIQAQGLIPTGQNQNTRSDYAYTQIENGVVLNTFDTFWYSTPEHLVLNSTSSAPFNVVTGPPAANPNSTVTSNYSVRLADGVESGLITVQLLEADNSPAHDKETILEVVGSPVNGPTITPSSCGEIGTPNISDQDGYVCYIVRSLYPGTFTFQATSVTDSVVITDTADVTFTGPNAAASTLTSDKTNALANGTSAITVMAIVKDSANNTFANRPITLQRTDSEPGSPTVTAIECPFRAPADPGITNSNGEACFTVTSLSPGTFSFIANNNLDSFTFPASPLNLAFGSGKVWGNDGLPIANAINDLSTYYNGSYNEVIETSDDYYIAVWVDDRHRDESGAEFTIYAQKFNGSGSPQWTSGTDFETNAIKIFDANSNTELETTEREVEELRVIPDASGGAIITWALRSNDYSNKSLIVGQRINSSGSKLWGSPYKVVQDGMYRDTISEISDYKIIADGEGGAFLTYRLFTTSPNWNGVFYFYDRYVNRIDGNGNTVSGDITTWPVQTSPTTSCENIWADILLTPQAGTLWIAQEWLMTSGSTCSNSSRRKPLIIFPINVAGPEFDLAGSFVNTSNMVNYIGHEPYDTEHGYGYGTGCTNTYAYDQGQPTLMPDGNAGVFIVFTETCDQTVYYYGEDIQIFLAHFPNVDSGYQPGYRNIGHCVSYSCDLRETDILATSNESNSMVFVGWVDRYDTSGLPVSHLHSIQKYQTQILETYYAVPMPVWDSNTSTTYKDPLPLEFQGIAGDRNGGLYVLNGGEFDGNDDNYPRLKTIKLDSSGAPYLNNITTNGWTPSGNQVSQLSAQSYPSENNMPYWAEYVTSYYEIPYKQAYLVDRSGTNQGDLVLTWGRFGIPFYESSTSKIFLQRMVGSTGLPAMQYNGSPDDVPLLPNIDLLSYELRDQIMPSATTLTNGETVFVWSDDLDQYNNSPTYFQIRGEKFDENGTPQWTTSNPPGYSFGKRLLNIYDNYSDESFTAPLVIADMVGTEKTGNFFVFSDSIEVFSGNYTIWRQKFDGDGNPLWSPYDGLSFSNAPLHHFDAVSDQNGGAYLFYTNGSGQIIGQHYYAADGFVDTGFSFTLTPPFGSTYNLPLLDVEYNGWLYLLYSEESGGGSEGAVKLAKINAITGALVSDIYVSSDVSRSFDASGYDGYPSMFFKDNEIYVAYQHSDWTGASIYAQKFNDNLEALWPSFDSQSNVLVAYSSDFLNPLRSSKISPDGQGGATIAWNIGTFTGYSSGSTGDVQYSHINTNGEVDWNTAYGSSSSDGIVDRLPQFWYNTIPIRSPALVEDGLLAGTLLAFTRYTVPNQNYEIILRHVINAIDQLYNSGNNVVANGTDNLLRSLINVIQTGSGSFIVAWQQMSPPATSDNDIFGDIYGQHYIDDLNDFNSDLTIASSPIFANNTDAALITATLLDGSDNPISGATMDLEGIYGSIGSLTISPVTCLSGGSPGITNSSGQSCWEVTSNLAGTYKLTAYRSSGGYKTVITPTVDLLVNELPTDPDLSTFTANPGTTYSDDITPSLLTATLLNTAGNPQAGKTIDIVHDGTNIRLLAVYCEGSLTAPGTSNPAGKICYEVYSSTEQTVTFTATVVENSIQITQEPSVTFVAVPADPGLSSLEVFNNNIEPINPSYFDYDHFNPNNAALIRVTALDSSYNPISDREVYLTPNNPTNIIIRGVTCDDPRNYLGSSTGITDSYGTACFQIYSTATPAIIDNNVQFTATVDGGTGSDIPLSSSVSIDFRQLAISGLYNYRFRNDDGNELTATPIESVNIPHYNITPEENFRLRIGVTRNPNLFSDFSKPDEFSPSNKTEIGPRPLPTPPEVGMQSFRAFPGYAIDESSGKIYIATPNSEEDKMRIYSYNLNNLSDTPTQFEFPSTVNYTFPAGDNVDQPIYASSHVVSNMWIDSDNNLMYLVLSPYLSESSSATIKVYKINLSTNSVIDVLTEDYPNSTDYLQDSFDAEIDLDNGFMYLTVGGDIFTFETTQDPSRIVKIKLNGPSDPMNKVGQLLLGYNDQYITSSVIDLTNQFMYVTVGNPQKIVKVDLDVSPTLPPVVVEEILLVPVPSTSPNEMVGLQAATIDTVNGYAYFASSTDFTVDLIISSQKTYITKVDIDPNRTFEVVSRLSITNVFSGTDSDYFGEYIYFAPNTTPYLFFATASIDNTNGYLYFPMAHLNEARGVPVWKIMRIHTDTFSRDSVYDELNYHQLTANWLMGTVFSPNQGRGYFVLNTTDGDILTEFNSTARINFKLQSSPNVDGGYCNLSSDPSYVWSDLPNSDFSLSDSSYFTDGTASTNVTGLLSENNESFVSGELKESSATTDRINLGQKEFTEIEYSIKANSTAKGSYCFRLVDADPNNNNQVGRNPDLIMPLVPASMAELDFDNFNFYIPATINGIILSKNTVNIIEGTTTDSYGVKLATQPTSNVTITVNANDERIILSPDSTPASPNETILTFTTSNWDTYQYISASSLNNSIVDGTTSELIHHTAASSDPAYNGIFIRPVNSVVTDYGSSSSNVIAEISGEATFTPPNDFAFPPVTIGTTLPNFSPALPLLFSETRGPASDYVLTVQASLFCKSPGICIPLDKVFLATANLINSFNTFSAAQIAEFAANYLQTGESTTNRATYVHSNSAEDKTLNAPVTLFDTRNVPSGTGDNPLQGNLSVNLHLMIDYGSITASLQTGTYTTTLTFDFNPTPP